MEEIVRRVVLLMLTLSLATAASGQGLALTTAIGNVRGVGDVNGDGRTDYSEVAAASLYLIHDGATGVPIPFLTRPRVSGDVYEGIGDIDGDGSGDLVYVPSPWTSSTIVSGADGSTLLTLAGEVGDSFDFDGDGLSDLVLRDQGTTDITTWIRSSRTGAALYSRVDSLRGSNRYYVRAIGDENGDGYEDAMLMAVVPTNESYTHGLLHGPTGSYVPWSPGGVVSNCGDIDADGSADLLLSRGALSGLPTLIFRGGPHTLLWTLPWSLVTTPLGDVDGDGFADVFILVASPVGLSAVMSGATRAQLPGTPPAIFLLPLGDIDGDGRAESLFNIDICEWVDPVMPIASRMLRRGVPGTTSSGRRPTIVTRGHCGLGHTVWFDVRGCEPNSIVAFAIGDMASVDLTPLGAPANSSYTTLLGVQALLADGFGLARLTAVMPTSPTLLGATVSVQAATFDPAANPLGLVTSNAIDIETQN